jgi:hypothetical protein
MDLRAVNTFHKLKKVYPVKTLVVRDADFTRQGNHLVYKDHRAFVVAKFQEMGVIVDRFGHNYDSLGTGMPQLGLVFMMNDSVIDPGVDVHALIGHNAHYADTGPDAT